MNFSNIGVAIKEARLEKKMTQSEVVGDFITRNMLSQIESGVALPSMKTLDYLAKKLDIPIGEFMDNPSNRDAQTDEISKQGSLLILGKDYYNTGKLKKAREVLAPLASEKNPFYDEACALLARISLSLGSRENLDIDEAISLTKDAINYASLGVYSNNEIKSQGLLMLNSLAHKLETNC